jgi:GrpB-like predicted nucleotidyltransferase (UPF0157 family)
MEDDASEMFAGVLGLPRGTVRLQAHTSRWREIFEQERSKVALALEGLHVGIHHIGSTSIPGVPAKPILDIAVELHGPDARHECIPRMGALGYGFRGEQGVEGRCYFVRGTTSVSYVHVHMFDLRHPTLLSYLAFRDHLILNTRARHCYVRSKRCLASMYPNDRRTYQSEKRRLVGRLLAEIEESKK